MNLLAIETSTDICSVSLCQGKKEIVTKENKIISGHTQSLAVIVDNMVKENNFIIKELDHILLSIGPGSYSGLRVATSFSKGLAYAIDKNIIPINTIHATNSIIEDNGNYYIAFYSHRDNVYYQKFKNGISIGGQSCDSISKLKKNKIYGYGLDKFSDINASEVKPSSLNLIKYIRENKNLIVKKNIAEISPIYLEKKNP